MGKLAKQLGLDAMGPTFTGPPSHIKPYSDFQPLSKASFFKFSPGLPMSLHQTVHELLLTCSNYQKPWAHSDCL